MSRLLDRTKKKIKSVIKLIDKIKSINFPYTDSNEALNYVRERFIKENDFLNQLDDSDSLIVIQPYCQRSIELCDKYLPVLGYIERSADLDGAVELHGPMLRITHKAIDKNAKLIISSEWYFSPFTALVDDLNAQGFVMVGMPCSDASNALIAPASGHELGHNIWYKENLNAEFEKSVREIFCTQVKSDWEYWKKSMPFELEALEDGFAIGMYFATPLEWAMLQCEEVFCDFVALLLFRESYLHTFEYLLAPGDKDRTNFNYPSLHTRATLMEKASLDAKIDVPEKFVNGFVQSTSCSDDPNFKQSQISDKVCFDLWEQLYKRAAEFLEKRGLLLHDKDDVERNIQDFKLVIPARNNKSIVNIINAAWRIANSDINFLTENYPKIDSDRDAVLNELMLKSFEVFEIEQRLRKS
jgi:hypothetical protein